jgi:hypothetical protein
LALRLRDSYPPHSPVHPPPSQHPACGLGWLFLRLCHSALVPSERARDSVAKFKKGRDSGVNGGLVAPVFDPIELPDGRQIETLRDATIFITKLPKRKHDAPEWRAAIEALILVADLGGPVMFARIGMMCALNAGKAAPAPRRKPAKVHRIVR